MAFTLAHPAVVIPLRKLPFLSLVPLIVGSMTPDLIGFLPYRLERYLPHSHSPIGSLLIDLPVGYLLLLVLLLLRHIVVQPLWQPHRSLIANSLDTYFARSRCWLIALPSLLIGSWTHIVWDRFTHFSGWTYRNLPLLYRPLFPEGTHELPLFHALQYLTSIVGLLFIAWCYWQAMQRSAATHPRTPLDNKKIVLLAGLALAAVMLGLLRLLAREVEYVSIYERLSLVLKTAMIAFGLLYLLAGLQLRRLATTQH
jgi:hypothetical protein